VFMVLVLVILAGTALWGSKGDMSSWGKKADGAWYAVYLNNNQVYFGHIAKIDDGTIVLRDVHFAEEVNIPAQVSKGDKFAIEQPAQKTFKLTARGGDTMLTSDHTIYLNRTSVAYWEKFNADAGVVKMLEEK
jgi:hypothetical protein